MAQTHASSAAPADERTALLTNDPSRNPQDDQQDIVDSPARYTQSSGPDRERPSSYIIVTAPTADNNAISLFDNGPYRQSAPPQHPPPRFRLFLPALALVDLLISLALCAIAYEQYAHPEPDRDGAQAAAHAAQRLAISLFACSVFRTTVLTGVGFSKQTRSMGVLIAATCLLSVLFVMSVANMLLEAHALRSASSSLQRVIIPAVLAIPEIHFGLFKVPELPVPVLPLFILQQLLFTVFEWAAFIAVVGVRLPPGRNPIQARRWARTLQQHHGDGVDARSLMEPHGEGDSGSEEGSDDAFEDNEQEVSAAIRAMHSRPKSPESQKAPSSIRPIAPQSPRFPLGSPSPAPSLNSAQSATQDSRHAASTSGQHPPNRMASGGTIGFDSSSVDGQDHPAAASSSHGAPDLELQLEASQLSLPASALSPDDVDEEFAHDPQDIIDIPADKQLSRQESRRRLAKAYARSNASSSSINDIPGSRRSMGGGGRRDSAISIRSTSTATGMGLPISTPSIPDRRTSTNFRAQSPPPITGSGSPASQFPPVQQTGRGDAPPSAAQGLLKGKSGKLGIGIGLGRRPSWLGGPKADNRGSSSGSQAQ
ncbi:hypothetical protein CF319_g8333 [Tilletia indica]|nr:hypothetical protein CF319_g8333 [Tilletia indica]